VAVKRVEKQRGGGAPLARPALFSTPANAVSPTVTSAQTGPAVSGIAALLSPASFSLFSLHALILNLQ
jgi:hypothetical protein